MRWLRTSRATRTSNPGSSRTALTGSQRIGHDNLRLRDPAFVADVERRLAERAGAATARPPMFLPIRLRDLQIDNRVVVSPMAQYMAVDGLPGDWHLVHYGARALGGAGLVFTEMTCVSPGTTAGCTGSGRRSGAGGAS
jgi:anthraniloyl-CoA monooxygenase